MSKADAMTRDEVITALTTHGDDWAIFWIDFADHVE
jgi:hypothetical protein